MYSMKLELFGIKLYVVAISFSSFFFTCFSLKVSGRATPDLAGTPLNQPTQTAFRLDKVPHGSNQYTQYNYAILYVTSLSGFFHSFQQMKFAWKAVRHSPYMVKPSKLRFLDP